MCRKVSVWAVHGRECRPPLDELSELGLSLLGRASVQSRAAAMITDTLLFMAQVGRGDARQGRDGVGVRAGMRQEFPGAGALYDAPGEAFLAGGAQQAAVEVAELTFAVVVGARQPRHIVGVKETGCVTAGDLGDSGAELLQARRTGAGVLDLGQEGLELAAHLGAGARGFAVRPSGSKRAANCCNQSPA
jgi:hypothetical protein